MELKRMFNSVIKQVSEYKKAEVSEHFDGRSTRYQIAKTCPRSASFKSRVGVILPSCLVFLGQELLSSGAEPIA